MLCLGFLYAFKALHVLESHGVLEFRLALSELFSEAKGPVYFVFYFHVVSICILKPCIRGFRLLELLLHSVGTGVHKAFNEFLQRVRFSRSHQGQRSWRSNETKKPKKLTKAKEETWREQWRCAAGMFELFAAKCR